MSLARLFPCLVLAGMLQVARAQDDAPSLESLRAIYQEHLAKNSAEAKSRQAAWPVQYGAALTELRERLRSAPSADDAGAVEAEIERFNRERVLTANQLSVDSAELRVVQKRFVDRSVVAILDGSRSVLALTDMYVKRMSQVQADAVKAGRNEEALAARDEIARVRASPEVKAATFSLAALDAETAEVAVESAPPEEAPAPPRPSARDTEPATIQDPDMQHFTFYTARKAAVIQSMSFRKLVLQATEATHPGKKISVEAALGTRSKSTRSRTYNDYGKIDATKTEKTLVLRLSLRATSTTSVTGATIVVQFFAKNVVRGANDPRQVQSVVADIPELDAKGFDLDSPAVTLHSVESRFTAKGESDGARGESSRYGEEFHGIAVTVFDAEGRILDQVVKPRSLSDAALTKAPINHGRK